MVRAVRDAFGQTFEMAEPAQRIISLIPSITEIFFTLGVGDRVVGVTKFCTEPPEGVAGKSKVGGQKNPRVDAIIDLKPDLVVANVEENRKEHADGCGCPSWGASAGAVGSAVPGQRRGRSPPRLPAP